MNEIQNTNMKNYKNILTQTTRQLYFDVWLTEVENGHSVLFRQLTFWDTCPSKTFDIVDLTLNSLHRLCVSLTSLWPWRDLLPNPPRLTVQTQRHQLHRRPQRWSDGGLALGEEKHWTRPQDTFHCIYIPTEGEGGEGEGGSDVFKV